MNKDIIRMAKEAGMGGMLTDVVCTHAELERFAELVRASEREACAKVCEEISMLYSTNIFPEDGTSIDCNSAKMGRVVTKNCAQSIRARGNE
jgi:hypothetical protein